MSAEIIAPEAIRLRLEIVARQLGAMQLATPIRLRCAALCDELVYALAGAPGVWSSLWETDDQPGAPVYKMATAECLPPRIPQTQRSHDFPDAEETAHLWGALDELLELDLGAAYTAYLDVWNLGETGRPATQYTQQGLKSTRSTEFQAPQSDRRIPQGPTEVGELPNCGGCGEGPHHCRCQSAEGHPVPTGCAHTQKVAHGHPSFTTGCAYCREGWFNTAFF